MVHVLSPPRYVEALTASGPTRRHSAMGYHPSILDPRYRRSALILRDDVYEDEAWLAP